MDTAFPQDRDFLPTLSRGLTILRAFTDQQDRLTLTDVAKIVSLPRATVRRFLLTLTTLGYVETDGKHFRITPQVLTLAQTYLSSSALPRITQPFLERLSETLGESCSVSVLQGTDVIYIARSARKRVASLHRGVGTHLPAYCTSMGRVLLAALPDTEWHRHLPHPLQRFTPHTIITIENLADTLSKTQQHGYSLIDQELEIDLLSLAVPLRDRTGRTLAALNVSTQASRTSPAAAVEHYLPALRTAAAELRPLLVG
jgi:IclR family pca regulon transcriptional regulator